MHACCARAHTKGHTVPQPDPRPLPCPRGVPCRYAFAYGYGDNPNEFIGDSLFAMSNWVRFNTNNTVGENWQA